MSVKKIKGIVLVSLLTISYGPRPSLGQSKPGRESGVQEQKQPNATPTKGKRPAKPKIDPDVYRRLEKSRDGRVYVMVTLKPLQKEAVSDEQRKAATKKSQDELVARMGSDKFEVGYRLQGYPVLFGHVSATGLAALGQDKKVVSVKLKVEAGVHQQLLNSPDGAAYIFVVLELAEREGRTFNQRRALVSEIQDRFLDRYDPEEFKVEWRYTLGAEFTGWASPRGLEELTRDPAVQSIGVIPGTRRSRP